ncbi:MAG: glycerol-3-phosphate 1-O-acyltransferase [Nitrospirae bacterium]|nr:MAG: glycerol-3-phosphate 1-O-acyltransferase [Nitrospirota bacterium]
MATNLAVSIVLGYFLGAIPVGIVAGRVFAGIDPRKAGSRNIGFTNVLRVAGKTAGIVTLIGDMGKGAAAVYLARVWLGPDAGETILAAGAAAILGHIFPIFLGFKGGKGVATALGVLLAADPPIGGSLVAVWLVSAAIWRMSSLAALIAFGSLPLSVWLFHPTTEMAMLATGILVLIVYRHRENIVRIKAGTESKFGQRPAVQGLQKVSEGR